MLSICGKEEEEDLFIFRRNSLCRVSVFLRFAGPLASQREGLRPKKKMFACGVVEKEGCRQKRLEKEVDVRAGGFTL